MSAPGLSIFRRAVRRAAIASLLLTSSALTHAALAQVTTTTGAPLAPASAPASQSNEEVTVTGSRLKVSDLTSEAPITVVTAKQIQDSSAQTIEDVLRKIPSIGSEGNFASTTNGTNGSSCIDIRDLGIARTLVLVDGKRFVHTGYGTGNDCVDLDTIPIALIDRIEILKDGASTIYGADAVAGVVNIIMKKNFVGTQLNLGGDITKYGDDRQGDISGATGFDFAQGRGNVAISGRYFTRSPVYQADRDWSNPSYSGDNGPGQPFQVGSGVPVAGRYFGADGVNNQDFTVLNGKVQPFVDGYFGAGANPNLPGRYNYGDFQELSNQNTTGNLAGNAHFDVNDHLTLYASTYYTHKTTFQQLSGQPISDNPNTGQSFDIPAGNPFAEALGVDQELFADRRTTDWGPRGYASSADTWQATGGARGNITGSWDYDAYFTYGHSNTQLNATNNVWWSHLEQEMGAQSLNDGVIDDVVYNPAVCTGSCVLANPFGANSFSKAAIDYASFTDSSSAQYQFRDIGASITNNKLVQLPYGPLGLAFGLEHRGEQGSYHPDPIIEAGDSTASIELPTGGGYSVTELFGEVHVPILKNLPAAKDLSGDVSGRWSDYSTFGGVQNFKAGINWSPTQDIRFRADLGTSVRQPQIVEAFGGDTLSFEGANDPCVGAVGKAQALCAAQGINTSTFNQLADQIGTIVGGNPNLQPESARTYTIGAVLTPRWVPDFTATIDYYHTKIENSIAEVPVQYVVDQCYDSGGSSPQCANIAPRNAQQQLVSVVAPYENLGEVRTNGIDFDMAYRLKLGYRQSISFNNELSDLIGYVEQQTTGSPFQNFKGRLSPVNTGLYLAGFPVIKDTLTATYQRRGFTFSWTVRFIDGMLGNDGANDYTAAGYAVPGVPSVFYHDLEMDYSYKNLLFTFGIDNVFDKDPPFIISGESSNTASGVYDIYGRLFYLKGQVKF